MRVTLGSAFRNSAGGQIRRYFHQVDALIGALMPGGHELDLILVEGDSRDNTREELACRAKDTGLSFNLVTRNHGKKEFGSTEDPERMKALSYVGNGILESVRRSTDVLFYVESDLIWKPDVLLRLADELLPKRIDVIAPLVFAGEHFYDVWGFRDLGGKRFGPFHPYSHTLKLSEPTEVGSVGSCLVMFGDVARHTRIPEGEALVGFCRAARENGYRVWTDARERVDHP